MNYPLSHVKSRSVLRSSAGQKDSWRLWFHSDSTDSLFPGSRSKVKQRKNLTKRSSKNGFFQFYPTLFGLPCASPRVTRFVIGWDVTPIRHKPIGLWIHKPIRPTSSHAPIKFTCLSVSVGHTYECDEQKHIPGPSCLGVQWRSLRVVQPGHPLDGPGTVPIMTSNVYISWGHQVTLNVSKAELKN